MDDTLVAKIHEVIEAKIEENLKPMGRGRERADKMLKRRIYVLVEALDAINEVEDFDGYQRRLKDIYFSYRNSVHSLQAVLDTLEIKYRRTGPSTGGPDPSLINLNTASVSVLELLPGIGFSLAEAIVEARKERRFTSVADLERVSGIGPSMEKKLEALATC